MTTQLAFGALFAGLVAAAAWRLRLLSRLGAVAAFFLGWVVFGLGGWTWTIVLMAFFISSSLLSRLFKQKKISAERVAAKGSRRDAAQVLANGGLAGVFVILHAFLAHNDLFWIAYCAALAAANADTWATELGVLNRSKPVKLFSGQAVEAGTSGAVSLMGTLAALAGAGFIGLFSWFLHPAGVGAGVMVLGGVTLAGLAGSLVDSALGAKFQAIFYCPACAKETEKHPRHGCGTETLFTRGCKWLNNDGVNLACTLSASLLAVMLGLLIF